MAIRKQVSVLASKVAGIAAHSYIAGPKVDDAVAVCGTFLQAGWHCSLGPWNSVTDSPKTVFDMYTEALSRMSGSNVYLSIKLPALNFDLGMIRDLAAMAHERGARIHLDSLSYETAEKTLRAFQVISKSFAGVGYTLPAQWRRSSSDAEYLKEIGARVRIVKGQWCEPGNACDARLEYQKLVSKFCNSRCHIEVATHDSSLAEKCIDELSASQTSFSLGQLYGLPYSIARRKRQNPIDVCLYIPYGHAYLPYALSQIVRQPLTIWWLIRDAARGVGTLRGRPAAVSPVMP